MSTTTTTTITTITPTSANAGTPTKVTKRHSTSGLKSAGFTMSKLSGCEHTRQILKQAQQQVIDKYTQIVEVLRDPYDLVHRTYKNKDGTTGVTTGITYLCLQCPNVSISRERHRKDHSFAVESRQAFVFCHECRDFVHDATLDDIREGPARERRRLASPHGTAAATAAAADEDRKLVNANTSAVPCSVAGLRGFYNMGQTCFMSVVLQALLHNPLIRTWFLTDGHKSSECERESCVACALDDIFSDFYSQEKREGYGAVQMLKCCWENSTSLAGYSQQDAHEFLSFILNNLHTAFVEKDAADKAAAAEEEDDDEGSPVKKRPPPTTSASADDNECDCIIHQVFAGLLQSTVTCSACHNTTTALDPFMDLSLDVRSTAVSVKKKKLPMTGVMTTVKEIAPMDLWECLERFTAAEVLGSDSYTCRRCDSAQEARKKLGLKRLPPVLPIHLKRFSHSKGNGQSSKVETRIRFPFTLDLEPYLASGGEGGVVVDAEAATYELSAVIVHKGKIDNGHYICYCRQGEYDWFRFDDSMVVVVDEKEVLGAEAYMLVYVAKWVPPP